MLTPPPLFQGYHDIITVLFLTLPPALHLPCTEKLSLHRLRDSMGVGLEPVLGLVRYVPLSGLHTTFKVTGMLIDLLIGWLVFCS